MTIINFQSDKQAVKHGRLLIHIIANNNPIDKNGCIQSTQSKRSTELQHQPSISHAIKSMIT